MIVQGTIVTRAHPKLKPEAPSTLALKQEERLEYAEETEQEREGWSTVHSQDNKTSGNAKEDLDNANQGEHDDAEYEVARKKGLGDARKFHNFFASQDLDLQAKFKQFEGNEYCACVWKLN